MNRFLTILLLAGAFVGDKLLAQQYSFISYSVEEGLAQSQVNDIIQDSKGYIWIATNGGLSRFDGKEFKNYYEGNGLLDNQMYALLNDGEGLWVGTLGGVNVIKGNEVDAVEFKPELKRYYVKCIAKDKAGKLWMGTDGGGLICYDPQNKKLKYYTKDEGLSDNLIRSLYVDDEKVWVGTKTGLSYIENDKAYLSEIVPSNSNISDLKVHDQDLWICTYGEGVYRYNGDSLTNFHVTDGLINLWIKSVTIDKDGTCWFTSIAGISRFRNNSFSTLTSEQGLPHRNINVAYEDKEGSIWLGSDGDGLIRFCGEGLVSYTNENGLGNNIVMSLAKGKDGALWVGTYGHGLAKKHLSDSFSVVNVPDISHNYIYSCLSDREGNIWFGTGNGLLEYSQDEFRIFGTEEGLQVNSILNVFEDSKGFIWVSTLKGVYRYDGEHFEIMDGAVNDGSNAFYFTYEDSGGLLWFATEDGIYSYDGSVFKQHKGEGKIKVENVLNIAEDNNGGLWFGTYGGLLYYDRKDFRKIDLADNFAGNQINSLSINTSNYLWAGTNNGIYYLCVDSFNSKETFDIGHIGSHQGLKSIECNQNAVLHDNEGNVFFGTTGGLVKIVTAKYLDDNLNSKSFLNLSGVRLFLEKTDWSPFADSIDASTGLPLKLSVSYKMNHLTFDFTGIKYKEPEGVLYKFKLEGFDEQWSPVIKEKFATYSNLPDGDYVFLVSLANMNGELIGDRVLQFPFRITPPFWKTWWFILSVILSAILATYGIIYWRLLVARRKSEAQQLVYKSKLLALEQETLNASMNRHFIFNALNSIQYYINRQDKLAANKYLTSFAKLIRKNLDSSQNKLVSLAEELERLELYLSLEHMRFNKFSYEIELGANVDADGIRIPPMILQPYVENSIWHGILPLSDKGRVLIKIERFDDIVKFIIEDNGIGIDASLKKKHAFPTEHDSKGMKITETRINLLRKMTGGKIEIKGPYDIKNEGNGTGTRVEIYLPIKN